MADIKYLKQLGMDDLQSNSYFLYFYRVKSAFDYSSRKEVAIKVLKLRHKCLDSQRLLLESFFKELKLLSECSHPNIVKLLDASFCGTLVTETIQIGTQIKGNGEDDLELRDAEGKR